MKKTFLVSALLAASVLSAFPFRTSCGSTLQVSQTIADHMTQNQLTDYLSVLNGEACPQHANSAIIIHVYYH
ncbi:hypothetical protein [Chryseobacterium camelliae]|uniref:hypothetical protein n=1 Tax=Chryseobacterium camelliae TaxID=1265445 RepID=UPI0012FE576C|nr:hypothetical protein [Chryseobacterium camelliae]MDR6516017.1 hypothetical protein [Chryseobacterium camelliae]